MRYLTWKEGKYHRGGNLLSEAQIANLSLILIPKFQVFASIQTYSESGEIISCPFYMDLDGDFYEALLDAQYATHLIMEAMGVEPLVFFSGNKGFHIIVPVDVHHPYCHYASKFWASMVSKTLTTLDNKVYRSRSMFRMENSKASREGSYKVRLSIDELMNLKKEDILKLAMNPRDHDMPIPNMSKINMEIVQQAIQGGETLIPPPPNTQNDDFLSDFKEDFTPCLKKLLYETPAEGSRNTAVFVLAKFLKRCDFNFDDGLNIVLSQPHWSEYEQEDNGGVSKVFKTIYRNGEIPHIGCRGSTDQAALMRTKCEEFCFFNSKMPNFSEVFKRG